MAITYSAVTNTITVTEYTEATPCNFTDIYNADVAGGWGVVTRQCTNQFCFDCKLVIGDASTVTWFADTEKTVIFIATASHIQFIQIRTNANFRIGEIINAGRRTSWKGCTITGVAQADSNGLIRNYTSEPTGKIEIYSSSLIDLGTTSGCSILLYSGNYYVWNSILSGMNVWMRWSTTSCEFYNTSMAKGRNEGAIFHPKIIGLFDKITITESFNGVVAAGATDVGDYTIKNLNSAGCPYVAYFWGVQPSDGYLINPDIDTWAFYWASGMTSKIYRQYEVDLNVVDSGGTGIDTAKVKIWNKDDIIKTNTTTNASGVLATQTLNYGYYNQSGGNTPVMKTPHEMRIYKYGKEMLSSKSSIEAKTDWALTMLTDDHITETTEATVAAYSGITINHTAETIIISEDHTLDEIYDYCQYDIISSTKQIDQTIHTADGVNFVSGYSFVVDTGITVTATDQKLSMVSGETYTLTGTAQFTGIVATTTTTRIPVKLTNIIDGSRYWVGKSSDGSEIFKGTQSGSGTVTGYYEHTANTDIDIRVRKSSASVKYLPWVGDGTLIASAFSLRIRQIQDNIVT